MVGSFPACCARAANGQAAAPPSSVMNSRRLMSARPQAEGRTLPHRLRESAAVQHSKIDRRMSESGQLRRLRSVRVTSAVPPKAAL
jgi:hypothetical protein